MNANLCFMVIMSLPHLCRKVKYSANKNMCASLVKDFRIYNENPKTILYSVQGLINAVEIISISTAKCTWGFSAMNLTLTVQRNKLQINTLWNLLFISINSPPVHCFKQKSLQQHWSNWKVIVPWIRDRRRAFFPGLKAWTWIAIRNHI